MLQKLKHIALCSSLLLVVGCTIVLDGDEEVEMLPNTSGTIVSLRIACSADEHPATRSLQGGAYGDGFELAKQWSTKLKGINYDYKVQDLCLFIVDTNGTSVVDYLNNSDAATPFYGAYYVDNLNLESTQDTDDGHTEHPIDIRYVAKVNVGQVKIEPFFHRVIVVANVGNITESCKTIGALREVVAEYGYTAGSGGNIYINTDSEGRVTASENAPSHFAMGLYEEPSMIQKRQGTLKDPHIASVTLERLSARVDFQLTNAPSERSQKADPFAPIPYNVKSKDGGETLSRNWITHVRLVNAADKPSYILRRTANDATGDGLKILGFEKADANHITTNYIIDPYTNNKASVPTGYYGSTELSETRMQEFKATDRVISRNAFKSTLTGYEGKVSAFAYEEDASQQYFIVGYTNENTLRPEDMTRDYTTGLLYRSIYEPATVYRLEGSGEEAHLVEDRVESLTTDVLSDGSCPDGGTKSEHYGKTFWMMERLVPNPTEADRVYFIADDEGDQEGDAAANGAGNTTVAGKTKIQKAAELYMTEHAETGWTLPLEYVGGVAYNYYWIRHSNSQGTGHPFSPMEYSIVRNNIYSVNITSFSGPGAPSTDPTMDNPDRIQPITYVHKWHPYTVEEVGM